MNIVLIGMMGCGKTTIGRELSYILENYNFIDTDDEIEKNTKEKISELFSHYGEQYFRALETEQIKQICKSDNQIISVGGGAFENDENRKILLENNIVIYLKASPQEIYNRIKNETHRPLLKKDFSVENIVSILNIREKNYEKAHKIIDTNLKTPYNIAQEILSFLPV